MVVSRAVWGYPTPVLTGTTTSALPGPRRRHEGPSIVAESLSTCRGEPEEAP